MLDIELLVAQARALLADEADEIANAANLAALVYGSVTDLNWVGFYFVRGDELVLGPFQGKPACTRIARGAGVCGAAWARAQTLVVPDVHAFPGHIACDSASMSEVVVPFHRGSAIAGVLDVDSPSPARFSASDVAAFEALAHVFAARLGA